MSACSPSGDPWLLTPGPLTTSPEVKEAARHDYGSRDRRFIDINRRVRERLVAIAGGQGTHVCVPLQGSGTFVVEAMFGTFVPPDGKALILANGAYGQRMAKICEVAGRRFALLETPEDTPVDPRSVDRALANDAHVTHVAVVHCETTSGVVNPVEAIARVCAEHSRGLLVDAMSAFGALPLDARTTPFEAAVAASGKCLESTPGLGFCIARHEALERARGNAHALSLDLHDQFVAMEKNGQWRFTPPVQTILSLDRALEEFEAEGGVAARGGTLPEQPRGPGERHARARLRDPAPGRRAGADHRDLPHAGGPAVRVRGLLRAHAASRLRHLSRQAHPGPLLPHRLHRPPGAGGDARRTGRGRGHSRRDGSRKRRPRRSCLGMRRRCR